MFSKWTNHSSYCCNDWLRFSSKQQKAFFNSSSAAIQELSWSPISLLMSKWHTVHHSRADNSSRLLTYSEDSLRANILCDTFMWLKPYLHQLVSCWCWISSCLVSSISSLVFETADSEPQWCFCFALSHCAAIKSSDTLGTEKYTTELKRVFDAEQKQPCSRHAHPSEVWNPKRLLLYLPVAVM